MGEAVLNRGPSLGRLGNAATLNPLEQICTHRFGEQQLRIDEFLHL